MNHLLAKSRILKTICEAIANGDTRCAAEIASREYPFIPQRGERRVIDRARATAVFVRDGFIDRYSGQELVFPGALALLSRLLPSEFPVHPNWKMSATHPAYWELYPIIDHLVPVARGGTDDESSYVTTSALRNSAKANWTIEELGWTLKPVGDLRCWDGLIGWFLKLTEQQPSFLADKYVKSWHRAAHQILRNRP